MKNDFKSILAIEFRDYLRLLLSAGRSTHNHEVMLRNLDSFLLQSNISTRCLDENTVNQWLSTICGTSANKVSYIARYRGLSKYLRSVGVAAFEPEYPSCSHTYTPYIFSDEEWKRMISSADDLPYSDNNPESAVLFCILLRIACYQVWNDLRDKLEGYYKDKPRVHNPLSKQKEFKAIKNSIIREADRLRLELEQEEMDSTNPNANEESGEIDSTETSPKTDSAQQPIKSPAVNNHNPAVIAAVTRLLYHMGQIFRDNAMAPTSPLGLRIDSKRRKKLMDKRLALGHKADDHEEQGWQNGPSM